MQQTFEMNKVYGQTLVELGRQNKNIMVLEADLMRSNGTNCFKQEFPSRTIDVGIAEANMVGIAAGLSNMGKIPYAATFGVFASRRALDQFFISCNYAQLNVKLVGSDPGITAAFNGGTHMPFEDLGIMRTIPNLTIVEPSDPISLQNYLQVSSETYGCWYFRLMRKEAEVLYNSDEKFAIGKGKVLKDGTDVTIVALGSILVPAALKASNMLKSKGISAAVIDALCVKPLDEELILSYARKTGAIVTAENANEVCGLGAAVASLLALRQPIRMAMVGSCDRFGQVGTTPWLQQEYKMTAEEIRDKVLHLLETKKVEKNDYCSC